MGNSLSPSPGRKLEWVDRLRWVGYELDEGIVRYRNNVEHTLEDYYDQNELLVRYERYVTKQSPKQNFCLFQTETVNWYLVEKTMTQVCMYQSRDKDRLLQTVDKKGIRPEALVTSQGKTRSGIHLHKFVDIILTQTKIPYNDQSDKGFCDDLLLAFREDPNSTII